MPSTRSQAGADAPAGEAAEVAEALEEAAAELSAEIAARKAAEARVHRLHSWSFNTSRVFWPIKTTCMRQSILGTSTIFINLGTAAYAAGAVYGLSVMWYAFTRTEHKCKWPTSSREEAPLP